MILTEDINLFWQKALNGLTMLLLKLSLRDDVYFNNGDKMTIDYVVWCCEKYRTNALSAGGWKMVDNIEKLDEKTIRFNLSYADVDFLEVFPMASITYQKYYEEVGDQAFGTHPIGTG